MSADVKLMIMFMYYATWKHHKKIITYKSIQAICSSITCQETSAHSWTWKNSSSFTGRKKNTRLITSFCICTSGTDVTYFYLVTFQAEGSELSAELEFVDQQNIILSMENRALRQRLDSLSQEQLIKHCNASSFSPF